MGLYFHQRGRRFEGQLAVIPAFFLPNPNNNLHEVVKHKEEKFNLMQKETDVLGDNPEIFNYQFTEKDEYDIFILKITFYSGIVVYLEFIPNSLFD